MCDGVSLLVLILLRSRARIVRNLLFYHITRMTTSTPNYCRTYLRLLSRVAEDEGKKI